MINQARSATNALLLSSLLSLSACTTFQGEYADPASVEVISDKWNESDARKTSEVLIKSMLEKPWLGSFKQSHSGNKPVVIVADIENRTDEHIDTKALSEAVRDEVINSGAVRFVDGERRNKILQEIQYQNSGAVAADSAKKKGKQIGADFMLTGAISSNVQTQGGLKTVTYQTVLQLTNLETAELEWSQKFDIKKRFKRSGAGW